MELCLTFALSLGYWFLLNQQPRVTYPDSVRYLAAGGRAVLHAPFHLRWLLPFVCRASAKRWHIVTQGSLILLPVMMFGYLQAQGMGAKQSLFGACLLIGLPGIFRMNALANQLVDGTAMLFMLASAICFLTGHAICGIALSCFGGMTKESTPVFTALACWNPLALIGLAPVLIYQWLIKPNPKDMLNGEEILSHPFRTGLKFHQGKWFSVHWMLLPLGVCIAGLIHPSIPLLCMMAVAYGQLFVATDTVRLYSWCFPLLILATVQIIPIEYAVIAVAFHWTNPFQKYFI